MELACRNHFSNDGGRVVLTAQDPMSELLKTGHRLKVLHLFCHGGNQPPGLLMYGPDGPVYMELEDAMSRLKIQADLVVVTGCFTGQVSFKEQAEFMGLARAFLVRTGAKALVVSLWMCGELESVVFSDMLYLRYSAGQTLGESMRGAMKWTMECTVDDLQQWLDEGDVRTISEGMREGMDSALGERVAIACGNKAGGVPVFPEPEQWGPYFIIGDPDVRYREPQKKQSPSTLNRLRNLFNRRL